MSKNKIKEKTMREVIKIQEQEIKEKPIELLFYQDNKSGWTKTTVKPSDFYKIVYLGTCKIDGDMFACYSPRNTISVFKGNLNSGKY